MQEQSYKEARFMSGCDRDIAIVSAQSLPYWM